MEEFAAGDLDHHGRLRLRLPNFADLQLTLAPAPGPQPAKSTLTLERTGLAAATMLCLPQ